MNIFPFTLDPATGTQMFCRFLHDNLDRIKQEDPDWSWHEVEAQVTSTSTVRFITFNMLDPVFGGRGWETGEMTSTVKPEVLAPYIEERKQTLAAAEYVRRENLRLAEESEAAIKAVYNELFNKDPS